MLLRVLVFEFITGGGLAQDELPDSLAKEGRIMLQVLVEQLADISFLQIIVLLDWRCKQFKLPENIEIITVEKNQCVYDLLPVLIDDSDYVWPIAPEMDGILEKISALVEESNTRLLNSSSTAIAICSDKWLTFQALKQHGLAVVETMQFDIFSGELFDSWVIKPKDGVGCLNCFLVSSEKQFQQIGNKIENQSDYIIQPYIKGNSLSLSCLFKDGKAWLLCSNQQHISVQQGQFQLHGCLVNLSLQELEIYQQLIDRVAEIIPGLWGYVGIDIMLTEHNQALILEINPRLTTSYAAIHQALGINVAEIIINMFDSDPQIKKSCDKQITFLLKKE